MRQVSYDISNVPIPNSRTAMLNSHSAVGLTAGVLLTVEVVALLNETLSLGHIAITMVVVGAAWAALHTLLIRRLRWDLTQRVSLLTIAFGLQAAVIAGLVIGITWWLPFAPALVLALTPLGHEGRRTTPRLLTQLIAIAALIGLGPGFSLGTTLIRPSTDPLSLRAVEWLRLRGGARIVNGAEHWWYSHHAPPDGGAPDIPLVVAANGFSVAASPSPGNTPGTTPASGRTTTIAPARSSAVNAAAAGVAATSLTPVRPLVAQPLPGEGQWTVVFGDAKHPAIAVTRIRPDAVHTSLVVALARMDTSLVRMRLLAGTEDPGGSWPEHGQVPAGERPKLLAVFNAGFRQRESGGGYWVGGHQGAPLVKGAASAVIHTDGTATVAQWGRDAQLGSDVLSVRQNLSLIVDNSLPVPGIDQANNARWGKTVGHKVLVWRSGMGVTKDGALIYAGGPGMSIKTLADVLVAAGSVRGMELDINSAWVAFFLYEQTAAGPKGTKLLPGMRHSPTRYLRPQSRDFFAVMAR